MKKPTDVTYWLDDRPPLAVILSTAMQQTAVMLVFIYPAIFIAREAQSSPTQAAAMLSMAFVVCGLGTILQGYGRRGIGCGFLGPNSVSPSYFPPAVLAVQAGGLHLFAGMTLAAGLAGMLMGRALHRLRTLMPPEMAGTVAFLMGLAICVTGLRALLQTESGGPPAATSFAVTFITLAVAIGLSVWATGFLRWISLLAAMVSGTIVAGLLGELRLREGFDTNSLPIVGLPDLGHLGLAFDATLLPAFLAASLAGVVKTVGLVTTLQKINDADWVRPEPRSISGGVVGEGIATALSGMLCAPAVGLSVTNVTIQAATGVTSRVIAYATGILCLLLACFPRWAALLSQIPSPVISAIVVYSGGLMLVNGMQLITSRMLDVRKSLAVALAVVAALSVEVVPHVSAWVPAWLRPLFSVIALGTLVAIALNALLRIGVRQRTALEIDPRAFDLGTVQDFADERGAAWGARRDIVRRAGFAMVQAVEAVVEHCEPRGPVRLEASFDEFNLDIRVSYDGQPLELPDQRPTDAEIRVAENGARRLAGYMLRRNADRVSASQRAGTSTLHFHFDH